MTFSGAISYFDHGRRCSRCGRMITGPRDDEDGLAVTIPLLGGGVAHYVWCAECMRRRRDRARKFGID